ncbi:hypothetical protein D3C86_1308630 [compost metagenome]
MDDVGHQAGQGPLVVEEALPAEDALLILLGLQPQGRAQGLQPVAGGVGQDLGRHAGGRADRRHAAAHAERDQGLDLGLDEGQHPLQVGLAECEIAGGRIDLAASQLLAQQEGVQRRQLVHQPQGLQVGVIGGDAEGLLHGAFEADLVDEDEAAAGLQVGAVDRHDDLGRHLAAAGKGVGLVAPEPVLNDERGVQRRGAEHGPLVPVVGLAMLVIDLEQVQHARRRGGAAQVFQIADGAISHGQSLPVKDD